jgi:hypothetical protein
MKIHKQYKTVGNFYSECEVLHLGHILADHTVSTSLNILFLKVTMESFLVMSLKLYSQGISNTFLSNTVCS